MLRDAIHIVCGDSAGGTLRESGLRVLVDRDVLAIGPVDPDPERNDKLRHRFWREEWRLAGWPDWPGWRRMRWPRRGKIVLWTSRHLPDRLFLWRAVDALASRDVELWQAEAPSRGVGAMPPERVESARISRVNVREARRMWSRWAAGSLREFVASLEPGLRQVVTDFLPGSGRRLSKRDRTILTAFKRWRTPLSGLRRDFEKLMVFGDLVLLTRLHRWIDRGALRTRKVAGQSQWTNVELLLTPLGQRLLNTGLRSPAEAPPLWLGGREVYGALTPG